MSATKGKPSQTNLRRAVSTAYYALFHCLARGSADLLVGGQNADRSKHAWRQVYRSLEHSNAKSACKNQQVLSKFPKEIDDFAGKFVEMQIKRHLADYDPYARFRKSEVTQDIDDVEAVINKYKSVSTKDRRAFCAFALLKNRP